MNKLSARVILYTGAWQPLAQGITQPELLWNRKLDPGPPQPEFDVALKKQLLRERVSLLLHLR